MKQPLPLFLIFFLSFFSLSAQEFLSVTQTLLESEFQLELADIERDARMQVEIENITDDTLRLRWQRYEMNKPTSWETQVCDNNACYLPDMYTNYDPENHIFEPVILAPGSRFTLTFHILPRGEAGAGSFDLDFSRVEEPEVILRTITFESTIEDITPPSADPSTPEVRLFPNPATEYVELTQTRSIDEIVVYNVLGREVRRFRVMDGKRYYLTGLPDGIYLVSLVNRQTGILKTLRLSKRAFRP